MRLLYATSLLGSLCLSLVTTAALAQITLPTKIQPAAPVAPAPQPKAEPGVPFDWKKIGKPLDDDTKSMMDRYVYMNADTTDHNVSLARPILSNSDISEWVKVYLGQVMTLDGAAYDRKLISNQLLFTPSGYADYAVYLKDANMDKFLKDNSYKMTGFVDGNPTISAQGLRDVPSKTAGQPPTSVYVWQIDAEIILSYLDYKNEAPADLFTERDKRKINNRFPLKVKLEIVRIPVQEVTNNRVAINRISFTSVPASTEPAK